VTSQRETMIERVARAMTGGIIPWEQIVPGHKEHLLWQARAAIEAMRVPTDEMTRAIVRKFEVMPTFVHDVSVGNDAWFLMIEAALAPPKKEG
jgi:hypothetical protein